MTRTARITTALATALAMLLAFTASATAQADFTGDHERAAAYFAPLGLTLDHCPESKPERVIYDDALLRSRTHVDQNGTPLITIAEAYLNSCEWTYGDVFLSLNVVKRCAVTVHEYGHMLGLEHEHAGTDKDPLRAMADGIIPACQALDPNWDATQASSPQADPMAQALLASRAREAAEMEELARRWDTYDALLLVRDTVLTKRDVCVERARDRFILDREPSKSRKVNAKRRFKFEQARARCRVKHIVPKAPGRPSYSRPTR